MLRFGETNLTIEKFYATRKAIKIWGINVNDIIISKLVKTKTNLKLGGGSFTLGFGWRDRGWYHIFFYFLFCFCGVVNCSFMAGA